MEGRERRRSIEIPTAGQIKPVGTLALKNFTIPRKKRASGQALLEPCPEESHDHALIESKLRESRLDLRKEHINDWLWKDVKVIHNETFRKEYSEKRSEMRVKGRHGREMEERFCFLVASNETTSQMYQNGLRTGNQEQYSLGKPSYGVYLFKYVDVALKHAAASMGTGNTGNLIIFKDFYREHFVVKLCGKESPVKSGAFYRLTVDQSCCWHEYRVLFGRIKKVTPSVERNKVTDPMVSFDCHMAKDAISYRESLSQQVLGSSVFLFDYNEKEELNQRPRQCLPYAVVSFVSAVGATPPTSLSPPVSPTKLPAGLLHGPLEHLKGCTVAERRGKGENATVTFKRFPSVENPGQEHQSPQADNTAFQPSEPPTAPYIHQQPQWPYYSAEYFNPSVPYLDNGSWQNYTDGNTFLPSTHNQSTMSGSESNTDESLHSFDSSAEKISTIVYSSRLVKDPRLSRQETTNETKSSEKEADASDEQGTLTESQNHAEKNQPNQSGVNQSSEKEEEHRKTDSSKLLLDNSQRSDTTPQKPREPLPSCEFLKMNYAAHFKMTNDQRHRFIMSQENHDHEGKNLQNNVRTENLEPLNNENNETIQSTLQNISLLPETHSVNSDTCDITSTTDIEDTMISKLDTHDNITAQDVKEFKENIGEKIEIQSDFNQNRFNSDVESLVKPVIQSALQMDPEKDETSEITAYSEQSTLTHVEPVCETDSFTNARESYANDSTLYNTFEVCSEFDEHNIALMDVASCIDIPVNEVAENNDCSTMTITTTEGHEQSGQSSPEHNDRESVMNAEADSHSDMSIEVHITEAQQNTTYNTLYKRLQLEQLLPSSNKVNQFSVKPYLRPKSLEDLPDEENMQLIVQTKSSQTPVTAEKLTLSDRFSKLRGFNVKLSPLIHTTSAQSDLNSDVKRDPDALPSSYDLANGNGISNAKLIQMMAHRYNEERLSTNGKQLKKKRAKMNGRRKPKSAELCKIASGQLLIHVLRNAVLSRKNHLLKVRRKYRTNLFPKRPCGRHFPLRSSNCLSSSETGDSTDKDLASSDLTSSAINQSQNSFQNKNTDNGFSQDDHLPDILGENNSNTDSSDNENKANHDGIGQESKEHISHPTESLDGDDLSVSNHINKDTPENETINISHQSSPIRHSENNESSNVDEINKKDHGEEDAVQKNQAQPSSTQGNDKNPDKVKTDVLSIPAAQTTGNVINRCTAEAQTVVNNKTGIDTTVEVLGESTLDVSVSCVTKPLVDVLVRVQSTAKSEEIEANVNIQSSDLFSHAHSKEANDKSFVSRQETQRTADAERDIISVPSNNKSDQSDLLDKETISTTHHDGASEESSLEPPKDDRHFVAQEPPESQNQSNSGDKKIDWVINPVVETTTGLHSKVINDSKQENPTGPYVIKDNLRSDWHGSNIMPSTSETRIITRLRDYLTKFESTVKTQESEGDSRSTQEHHAPMTWISLDSTVHKHILDTRHYNRPPLVDHKHPESGNRVANVPVVTVAPTLTVTQTVTPTVLTKHKHTEELNQPSWTLKRRKRSKAEGPSPDSTSVEPVRKETLPHSLPNKDTPPSQLSSTVQNRKYWLHNPDKIQKQHQTMSPQGSGNRTSRQQCQVSQPATEKANKSNEQAVHNEKMLNSYIQKDYNVTNISSILKLADHAVSLAELTSLQAQCGRMLDHFISNFEKSQSMPFSQSGISRKMILEKYLDRPPPPVQLKFEAINSFLELQMMLEAWQFVENKISFLKKRPTFRSLLWYDPSLYGELYKGAVGFQQQSSLFSSFQQCLASEDFSKLQEYYNAVSTLHQQLQDAPDTSYYMYLKTKRERLEVEAALRNPPDVKSFFLSVPVAIMMNFGDTLETLEKVQHTVTMFIETPADQLPGIFDVGKAEHLSIICRFLHEKALFLKSNKEISKVSWFGLEHLLYDASKVLVWSESTHEKSNEVLKNYKKSNPQIVYGVTEAGVTLVNKMDQRPQTVEKIPQSTSQEKIDVKPPKAEKSNEKAHFVLNSQSKEGIKETNPPAKRRVSHPTMRANSTDCGVAPVCPTPIPAQLGNTPPYHDFPQRSNSLHWRMPANHVWDWTPQQPLALNPEVRTLLLPKRRMSTPQLEQRATVPDQQNHTVRQQRPRPLLVKPRPVERVNHPPLISIPHHTELSKEPTNNKFTQPIIKPLPLQRFPIDTTSVMPSPLPPLPFSNTLNPSTLQNNAAISYPYFIFNGQTYSTAESAVPVTPLHNGTQYHPYPV